MNIKKIAYELYKKSWVHNHVTMRRELDNYIEYAATSNDECTYEEYIREYGFDGSSVYSCYEEFIQGEYRFASNMKFLFGETKYGRKLYKLYLQDIDNDKGEI